MRAGSFWLRADYKATPRRPEVRKAAVRLFPKRGAHVFPLDTSTPSGGRRKSELGYPVTDPASITSGRRTSLTHSQNGFILRRARESDSCIWCDADVCCGALSEPKTEIPTYLIPKAPSTRTRRDSETGKGTSAGVRSVKTRSSIIAEVKALRFSWSRKKGKAGV